MASEVNLEVVKAVIDSFLDNREYPKTICPSEPARAIPAHELNKLDKGWRDAMPLVRDILFKMRDAGQVEILQKGNVLSNDIYLEDIKGPIRARRIDQAFLGTPG